MQTPGIVAGGETDLAIARAIINAQISSDSLEGKSAAVNALSSNQAVLGEIKSAADIEGNRYGVYGSIAGLNPDEISAAGSPMALSGAALRVDTPNGGIDVLPMKVNASKPSILGVAAVGYALYWIFK